MVWHAISGPFLEREVGGASHQPGQTLPEPFTLQARYPPMIQNRKTFFSDPRKVLSRLAEVVEVCDELAEQLDTLGVAVDDIKQTLGELVQAKPDLNALLPAVGIKTRKSPLTTAAEPRHATTVTLAWEGQRARVTIDGNSVILPRMPGLLMEILLSDEAGAYGTPTRDGWHSRADLELRLSSRVGRLVSRHALENLISRLKGELRRQGKLAEIVQTNNYREVRIARQKHTCQRPIEPTANPPLIV